MSTFKIIILIAVGVLLTYGLMWRIFTRWTHLPCPPIFIGLLESQLMENVAGAEVIIQRANIKPRMRVLDAGCGPGRVTVPLAKYLGPEGEVVAFDIQSEMLSRLSKRLLQNELNNVIPVQGAFGEGLLGTTQFDRVIMVTVLGEIPDQFAALKEVIIALKPSGILSVTEVLPDPHYQNRKKVRHLAEEAGFSVEVVHSGWRSYTLNMIKSH